MISTIVLASRIYDFLEKYARVKPEFDPIYDEEDDKYTSPDASELRYCANMLQNYLVPDGCRSEWGSGGYVPYGSKEGREEHDYLVSEIYKVIKSK